MIEKHPFGYFVPKKTTYLVLGSFTTKEAYDKTKRDDYVWFYSNGGRNQFWPILSEVYDRELLTRRQMEILFTDLQMALGDIITQCERKRNSNLDITLTNIEYGVKEVDEILANNSIKKIYFTSRFVEQKYKSNFKSVIEHHPEIELITLPSPSPRYVLMTKHEKLTKYRQLLPQLEKYI